MTRLFLPLCLAACLGLAAVVHLRASGDTPAWNTRAAAAYLDGEMKWWSTWPNAARDHGTFCVSCHTATPYVLARPLLQKALAEPAPSPESKALFENVSKCVKLWNEVAPYYPDQTRGIPKTSESRGTEAVLNALVLATRDGVGGTLGDDTRLAFSHMWALQMRTGDLNGAWAWLNFRYEPWESPSSPYFGAAMAAIAIGTAPGYAASDDARPGVERLRAYVSGGFERQNLFNRLTMIVAAGRLHGLVTDAQRQAAVDAVVRLQRPDGGWSLSTFGDWKRVDDTPLDSGADGYATALAALALRESGQEGQALERARAWLVKNQDPQTGRWRAVSLNRQRDPASDPARFMNDAATAYAVMALMR